MDSGDSAAGKKEKEGAEVLKTVNVRDVHDQRYDVDYTEMDTVKDVIDRYLEQANEDASFKYRAIHMGRVLDPESRLDAMGVSSGDIIQIVKSVHPLPVDSEETPARGVDQEVVQNSYAINNNNSVTVREVGPWEAVPQTELATRTESMFNFIQSVYDDMQLTPMSFHPIPAIRRPVTIETEEELNSLKMHFERLFSRINNLLQIWFFSDSLHTAGLVGNFVIFQRIVHNISHALHHFSNIQLENPPPFGMSVIPNAIRGRLFPPGVNSPLLDAARRYDPANECSSPFVVDQSSLPESVRVDVRTLDTQEQEQLSRTLFHFYDRLIENLAVIDQLFDSGSFQSLTFDGSNLETYLWSVTEMNNHVHGLFDCEPTHINRTLHNRIVRRNFHIVAHLLHTLSLYRIDESHTLNRQVPLVVTVISELHQRVSVAPEHFLDSYSSLYREFDHFLCCDSPLMPPDYVSVEYLHSFLLDIPQEISETSTFRVDASGDFVIFSESAELSDDDDDEFDDYDDIRMLMDDDVRQVTRSFPNSQVWNSHDEAATFGATFVRAMLQGGILRSFETFIRSPSGESVSSPPIFRSSPIPQILLDAMDRFVFGPGVNAESRHSQIRQFITANIRIIPVRCNINIHEQQFVEFVIDRLVLFHDTFSGDARNTPQFQAFVRESTLALWDLCVTILPNMSDNSLRQFFTIILASMATGVYSWQEWSQIAENFAPSFRNAVHFIRGVQPVDVPDGGPNDDDAWLN